VYCAVSKKRCVPFIPFLCAGTAVSLILSGMGLGYCDGGLL
jgi:prepilin signal peptidase PulO-like enzyme (type II secretory pathway)